MFEAVRNVRFENPRLFCSVYTKLWELVTWTTGVGIAKAEFTRTMMMRLPASYVSQILPKYTRDLLVTELTQMILSYAAFQEEYEQVQEMHRMIRSVPNVTFADDVPPRTVNGASVASPLHVRMDDWDAGTAPKEIDTMRTQRYGRPNRQDRHGKPNHQEGFVQRNNMCYKCKSPGHFKRDCPLNRGN